MTTRRLVLLSTFLMTVAACAPRFARLPDAGGTAATVTHNSDVRLAVSRLNGGLKLCACPDLAALQIALENQSDTAVAIRYDQFAIRTPSGDWLPSLPAFDISNPSPVLPSWYRLPWSGFHLAPHLSHHYRGFWTATQPRDDATEYYDQHHPMLLALATPTTVMRRQALPEGMLEPGGQITGVLFFRRPETPQATLIATIVAEADDRRVARFEVPVAFGDITR